MSKTNPAFMSGVPELLVLRLLTRDEMYGYELVKAIRNTTLESITLAEGVVYPVLHNLEAKGMLRSREVEANGRSRVYYKTTAKGKRRLKELLKEWDRVSGGINAALGDTYA
ncbi:MAG: PadR family transcriptional regulator [Pseudomonadales bacterium]|nr:PadR family transcriptional regulator [Pseudomonadales bacterium]